MSVNHAIQLGVMPIFYQDTAERIVEVDTLPLLVYPILLLTGPIAIVVGRVLRRRR